MYLEIEIVVQHGGKPAVINWEMIELIIKYIGKSNPIQSK